MLSLQFLALDQARMAFPWVVCPVERRFEDKLTIQRDEKKLRTVHQAAKEIGEAISRLSEFEKAKLRVTLRLHYGLPAVRERALEN
jgi:hypothetical protein